MLMLGNTEKCKDTNTSNVLRCVSVCGNNWHVLFVLIIVVFVRFLYNKLEKCNTDDNCLHPIIVLFCIDMIFTFS